VLLTCAACASAKVDTKLLKAATETVKTANVATLECPALAEKRDDLMATTAGAVVKPKTVDLTSPTGIAKAKDLSAPGTAASVALTTVKSTIPGAGFLPLITGSARREAKRSEAINDARVTLAKLEGAMLVKGCPIDGEGDTAANAEAAVTTASAEETAAAPAPEEAASDASAPAAEPAGEAAPAIIEK
jgi:hypothetical protein